MSDHRLPEAAEKLSSVRARREALGGAMDALEAAASAPAAGDPAGWAAALATALAQLRSQYELHVEVTEGPGGLHEEILEHSPRLTAAVERLAQDHEMLAAELTGAIDGLGAVTDTSSAEALQGRVVAFIGHLARHRHQGANLVYEAYSVDLSSGG
jgi:hypothetical protein